MKSKKFFAGITALCVTLIFGFSEARAQSSDSNLEQVEITNSVGTQIYTTKNDSEVKGSPLYNKDFTDGYVIFKNGKKSEVVPINLDTHQNLIVFKQDGKMMVLSPVDINGFVIENGKSGSSDRFVVGVESKDPEITKYTPLRSMYEGENIQMYAFHKTHLIKGNTKDPFTGKVVDRYYNDTKYVLRLADGSVVETKDRVKDVIKDLPKEHHKELEKFMKKRKLKNKSQKDIAVLLAYYNDNVAG